MSSEAPADLAIRVERVGKRYQLGAHQQRYPTLRDAIATRASSVVRRVRHPGATRATSREELWALKDVTLDVSRGDAIGVIGHNGSGKSTFLKILSRITLPTVGRVEIRGRVGTLLEIGTGFHNELTGRENIYLNGAILGLTRADITRRFDAIVEFAEVSRFLDTPVKWYSSGMYLRLAFSVAAHLEPQILLVDEVLAVGDAAFQRKCLGRMSDVARQGRTVVFVSHDLDAIQRLCTNCVLLDGGRVAAYGSAAAVVQRYLSNVSGDVVSTDWIDLTTRRRSGTGDVRFVAAKVSSDGQGGGMPRTGGPLELTLRIESDAARRVGSMAVSLETLSGIKLIDADIMSLGKELALKAGMNSVRLRIAKLHLNADIYSARLWLGCTPRSGFDHVPHAFQIEVVRPPAAVSSEYSPGGGTVACCFDVVQDP